MDERENLTKQGRNMESKQPESKDWFLPAVLVAIAGSLLMIAAIVFGVQSNDVGEDSTVGQLEQWAACLRSEGANVPHVETVPGGGFQITVDGTLVDEGINWGTLGPALDACDELAPEELRSMMPFIGGFSEFPHLDFEMFEFGGIDEIHIERDDNNLSEICDRIEKGEIDLAEVPRRLRLACAG